MLKIASTLAVTAAFGLVLSQSTPPVHAATTTSQTAAPISGAQQDAKDYGGYWSEIGKGAITGAIAGAVSCGAAGAAVGAVVGAGAGAAGWLWDHTVGMDGATLAPMSYPPDALDHI